MVGVPFINISVVLFLFVHTVLKCETSGGFDEQFNDAELQELREEARGMFYHAYDAYLDNAYPADELMPLSCKGRYRDYSNSRGDIDDALGNFSLTLIDSMDTLAIFGDFDRFEQAIKMVIRDVSFNKNIIVSVFETNIRVLGGLISSHVICKYVQKKYDRLLWYQNELLDMSIDLGYRILPAFNTETGIPHARINLKFGMNDSLLVNSRETCTACAGSIILEMAALSRLSGERIFENKARQAMDKLWALRHRATNLMGTVLNIHSGDWISKESGVGAGIDSYYEYLLKAYVLLGDDVYYERFEQHYSAIMKYISQRPMLVDVHMHRPLLNAKNYMDALQAFWPGLQVLKGDLKPAVETHEMLFQIVKRHNFIPEAFTSDLQVYWSQHPLRPEFVESTYFLYQATQDPYYLNVGKIVLKTLQKYARVACGFAAVSNVNTGQKEDRLDSFVLSETFKYLYLLFSNPKTLPIDLNEFVFTTEAHLLPLSLSSMSSNTSLANDPNSSMNRRMCLLNYDIESIRKLVQDTIQGSTVDKFLEDDLSLLALTLRPGNFVPADQNHIAVLKKMGISVNFNSLGNYQFSFIATSAQSNFYALQGASFFKELLNNINSNTYLGTVSFFDEHNERVALICSSSDFQTSSQLRSSAKVLVIEPEDCCEKIVNGEKLKGRIAIAKRGACTFVNKARLAEAAGATGLIVLDNVSNSSMSEWHLFTMSGDGKTKVGIPTVFLYDQDAQTLLKAIRFNENLQVNVSTTHTSNQKRATTASTESHFTVDEIISAEVPKESPKNSRNESSPIIVFAANELTVSESMKNGQLFFSFSFGDKSAYYRLLKHDYSMAPYEIQQDLFIETFRSDRRSTVNEMFLFLASMYGKSKLVYRMKLINVMVSLHSISNNVFEQNKTSCKQYDEPIEPEVALYENDLIRVKTLSIFVLFGAKESRSENLTFFIALLGDKIDAATRLADGLAVHLANNNTDSYLAQLETLHLNEFIEMKSCRDLRTKAIAVLERFDETPFP